MNASRNYIFGRHYGTLNDQIVAYYGFENNVIDSVNSNNGTYFSPIYSAGVIGQCSNYGASRYITLPQTTNLDFSDASSDLPFSLSFWHAKVDSASRCLFSKRGGTAGTDQWQVNIIGGLVEVILYSNSTSAYISKKFTGISVLNNVFYHYCITYDGSGTSDGIKMYFNGADSTTTTANVGTYTKMPQASQLTYIGRLWNGTMTLAGRIDEFAVWKNRVLTDANILEIYNSGLGLSYPF